MAKAIIDKVQGLLNQPLQDINTIEKIDHDDFFKNHIKKNKPVKITQMMDHWKATELWSLDYFEEIGKNKETYTYKGNIRQNETNWQYGAFQDYLNEIRKYRNRNLLGKHANCKNVS